MKGYDLHASYILSNGKLFGLWIKNGQDTIPARLRAEIVYRFFEKEVINVQKILSYYKLDESDDLTTKTLYSGETIEISKENERYIPIIDSILEEFFIGKKYDHNLVLNYIYERDDKKNHTDIIAGYYNEAQNKIMFKTFTMFDPKSINSLLPESTGKATRWELKGKLFWLLTSEKTNNYLLFSASKESETGYGDISIEDLDVLEYIVSLGWFKFK